MWNARYWANRFWALRYWAKSGDQLTDATEFVGTSLRSRSARIDMRSRQAKTRMRSKDRF